MFLQQIVIYALLGVILDQLGADWTNSLYWCALVLVGTSNYLARRDGFYEGIDTANETLVMSNRILDEARKYIDDHATKMQAEKQELLTKLEALKKHKENNNV